MGVHDLLRGRKTARQFTATVPMALKETPAWGRSSNWGDLVRQAIVATRRILQDFPFPLPPDIRYQGPRTASVNEAFGGGDDVIVLNATITTASGVRNDVDIPVFIRNGQVVDPGVLVYAGAPRVIAPSTFEAILKAGTFTNPLTHRDQYGAPPSVSESQTWYEHLRKQEPYQRRNPGMFSLANYRGRLAVRSPRMLRAVDAAFARRAQMTDAVQLLEQWAAPAPDTDDDMDKLLKRLVDEGGIDPVDALDALDIVYELWHDKVASLPPAFGDTQLECGPAELIGDRVHMSVRFSPEQSPRMSDGYLFHLLKTYVQRDAQARNVGQIIADFQIDHLDRGECIAEVSFKSSETNAPALAGPNLRLAAVHPTQDKTDLAPAERGERDNPPSVGDDVALKKQFEARSRGGAVHVLEKGSKGKVVKDLFGDGLSLEVQFEGARTVVPAGMLKMASRPRTAQQHTSPSGESIVAEIDDMLRRGYGPADAIVKVKGKYGKAGDDAIRLAKQRGVIS